MRPPAAVVPAGFTFTATTKRRSEFPTKVKAQALERCGGRCEGARPDGTPCGVPLVKRRVAFDHDLADGLGGEPTLANCRCLCLACHGEKTSGRDVPAIAKAKRLEARENGLAPRPRGNAVIRSAPFPKRVRDRAVVEKVQPPRRNPWTGEVYDRGDGEAGAGG